MQSSSIGHLNSLSDLHPASIVLLARASVNLHFEFAFFFPPRCYIPIPLNGKGLTTIFTIIISNFQATLINFKVKKDHYDLIFLLNTGQRIANVWEMSITAELKNLDRWVGLYLFFKNLKICQTQVLEMDF